MLSTWSMAHVILVSALGSNPSFIVSLETLFQLGGLLGQGLGLGQGLIKKTLYSPEPQRFPHKSGPSKNLAFSWLVGNPFPSGLICSSYFASRFLFQTMLSNVINVYLLKSVIFCPFTLLIFFDISSFHCPVGAGLFRRQ